MLPKKIRASSSLIDVVFKKGERVSSPLFDLVYSKADTAYSLFAVSVSKKAAKTSVERHMIRRICYNAMGQLHIKEPFVCVLIVKKSIPKKEIQGVKKLIDSLFLRSHILRLS